MIIKRCLLRGNLKSRIFLVMMLVLLLMPLYGGQNVVSRLGQLKVIGNRICDSEGNPVQLKGISSHGLQWFPFTEDNTLPNLVNLMEVDVLRAAMYVKEWDAAYNHYAGYLGVHPEVKETLKAVIRDAIDAGIYVIVDWHIHWNASDYNNPHWTNNPYTSEAVAFFREIANTTYNDVAFKDYPNVIWEVMNEPGHTIQWSQVKSHCNTVIDEIRNGVGDSDNLILVPSPNWAQNLNTVAYDGSSDRPDRRHSNIAYTLHFYAATHGQSLRSNAEAALNAGLAIFATEWGTSEYTGNGVPNYSASEIWINWMNDNQISWTNWSFCDKNEGSAALDPGVGLLGPWATAQLSDGGGWIKNWIDGGISGGSNPAQSSSGWNTRADMAWDGNVNGEFFSNSVTHTVSGDSNPWWYVDLGSAKNIYTIDIWNRTDCCSYRLDNFTLFVSNTPFGSEDPATTANQTGVWTYYGGTAATKNTVNVNRSGRYIRIHSSSANPLSLAEVVVNEASIFGWNPNTEYKFISLNSGKAISHTGHSDTNIIQWDYHSDWETQHWKLSYVGGGYYRVKNSFDNSYLTMSDSLDNIVRGGWASDEKQYWKFLVVEPGVYKMICKYDGRVADVANKSKSNGGNILPWAYSYQSNQKWLIQLAN